MHIPDGRVDLPTSAAARRVIVILPTSAAARRVVILPTSAAARRVVIGGSRAHP